MNAQINAQSLAVLGQLSFKRLSDSNKQQERGRRTNHYNANARRTELTPVSLHLPLCANLQRLCYSERRFVCICVPVWDYRGLGCVPETYSHPGRIWIGPGM